MLARKPIDPRYLEWNRKHGAPLGYPPLARLRSIPFVRDSVRLTYLLGGPFAFQDNSSTRSFEYPWAYFAAGSVNGLSVVEIGGGYSGLQFVLAKNHGISVTNVDPGIGHVTWRYGKNVFSAINACARTHVRLIPSVVEKARIPSASVDRILCISVLEHLTPRERLAVARESARILKPGGLFIATVDLFLDIRPFSRKKSNIWGTNMDIRSFVSSTGLRLLRGDRRELFGYQEFSAGRILRERDSFVEGETYPVLVQCFVLGKPR